MIVSKIFLKNYRNYDDLKINFHKNINIIIGDNAQGKTNILESIYFLSITRSYRTSDDNNLIKNGKETAEITARLKSDNVPKKIEVSITRKEKKIKVNNTLIKRVSDFIGILNVILIAPEDVEIIKGSPILRRNFFNIELSKLSNKYITQNNEYNKLLKMRNDYLKLIMTNSVADNRYLDIITQELVDRSIYIYRERKKFIDIINPILADIYYDITGISNLSILYIPNIDIYSFEYEDLRKKISHNYHKYQQKEILLGMTLYGPHRDDFKFLIDDQDIKNYGSQGQQKLAIIALKLSILKIFEQKTDNCPVLLLDDIFSELDKKKKNKLIKYINAAGQVIITTNDIKDINKRKLENIKIFEIKNSKIIEKGDKNGK